MKKKMLSTLLATVLLGMTVLTGCGEKDTETNVNTAASEAGGNSASENVESTGNGNDEQTVLRFAWWGGEERHAATLEAIEKYEELHPEIKIEAEYSGYDGYQQKLITQLAGNTAADIVQVDWIWLPDMAYLFTDLNQFSEINTADFDKDFLDMSNRDGKLVGLPTGINTNAWMYNKEFTDQFNLDMTKQWTWDDVLEYGRQIHEEDPDSYLINASSGLAMNMLCWYLEQKTGEYWINENYELAYTQLEWEEAFNMYQKWIEAGVIEPLEVSSVYESRPYENPSWTEGNAGTLVNWISDISGMSVNGTLDIHIANLPTIAEAEGTGIILKPSQIYSVPEACEHKEEAAAFLNWLLTDPEAAVILRDTRGVPAAASARDVLAEKGLLSQEKVDAINHSIEVGALDYPNISLGEADVVGVEALQSIGYGVATPEQAADKLVEQLEIIISNLK